MRPCLFHLLIEQHPKETRTNVTLFVHELFRFKIGKYAPITVDPDSVDWRASYNMMYSNVCIDFRAIKRISKEVEVIKKIFVE